VGGAVSVDVFTATGLDGRASYSPEVSERLWMEIPAELRLERYTPETVPAEHRDAFAHGRQFRVLDLSGLPVGLRRELAWSVAAIIARGGLVPRGPLGMLAGHLPALLEDLRRRGVEPRSLMHFSPSEWEREFQREVWDPELDCAVPLRAHEPDGEKVLNFLPLRQDWLRAAAQWYFKVSLALERLTWSTVRGFLNGLAELSGFLEARGITDPWLRDHPAEVRVLMLDFLGELKARKFTRGRTKGQPLSGAQVANHMVGIEGSYRFMHDEREQAAVALGDRRWLRLGPEHTRFWRFGEKPARHHPIDERHLLTDAAFSQIMAGLHVLGDPVSEGGLGDEQAMRALMLLARTGRRSNEILLLDFDPLIAIGHTPAAEARRGRWSPSCATSRPRSTKRPTRSSSTRRSSRSSAPSRTGCASVFPRTGTVRGAICSSARPRIASAPAPTPTVPFISGWLSWSAGSICATIRDGESTFGARIASATHARPRC
jgi:hypothetical protein